MKQLVLLLSILCFKTHAVTAVFQNFSQKYGGIHDHHIKTITEDNDGYIWFGTDIGVYKFNGYQIKKIELSPTLNSIVVKKLLFDSQNRLWIATKKNGLLLFDQGNTTIIKPTTVKNIKINDIFLDHKKYLWIASSHGLFTVSPQKTLIRPQARSIKILDQSNISAMSSLNHHTMILASPGSFFLFNLNDHSIESIKLTNNDVIHDIHASSNEDIWIASAKKLYHYKTTHNTFVEVPKISQASRFLALAQHQHYLWLATIDGGLYQINTLNNAIRQFSYDGFHKHSIAEKNLISIFVSSQQQLWVGGFSTGLSMLDLNMMKFSYHAYNEKDLSCIKTNNIISINAEDGDILWLGNEYGLFKYNSHEQTCEVIDIKLTKSGATRDSSYTVYHTWNEGQYIWISSSKGLLRYDQLNHTTIKISDDSLFVTSFFSTTLPNNNILIGTDNGLYELYRHSKKIRQYHFNNGAYSQGSFLKFSKNNKNHIFLPTKSGLLMLDENNQLNEFPAANKLFTKKEIIAAHVNAKDELFVSVNQSGLYHLSMDGTLIKHYFDHYNFSAANPIYQIQSHDDQTIWISSKKGIIYLDTKNQQQSLFIGIHAHNYLSGLLRTSNKLDNTLYFAGNNGLLFFNPDDIEHANDNKSVLLDQLYLANRPISINTESKATIVEAQNTNKNTHLTFTHQQKIIGFDFTTLNYKNPDQVKFAYRLLPTFDEWVTFVPESRNLTFTNLASGTYKLSIKATGVDQKWNDDPIDIMLNIQPAPWLTWWAYLLYFFIVTMIIYIVIKNKLARQKKINAYLNKQVSEQTAHIKKQKATVEKLMDRRNEIFSNVTHEFRTPITLIQGPVSELKKNINDKNDLHMIEIINRNSNRLLRLVDQMLSLSHVMEYSSEKKHITDFSSQLKLIIEPYKYIAKKQRKKIIVKKIDHAELMLTDDALDIIIGNLLSNAIKYSEHSSHITIEAQRINKYVEISITDKGPGISEKERKDIFKRFNRLTKHQNISGVGIGLSLVKEVIELNDGKITVESNINQGSCFIISLPIYHDNSFSNHDNTLEKEQFTKDSDKATILIIEDNKDMLDYIERILQHNFNCLRATNGKEGIAIAIKNVPDIIISDVMMPGIDGFHVSKIIRNEMITSHIPLVLLTALNGESYRIKGWREKIDMYLTKPFSAEELNVQLINILKIRNLIHKKNSHLIKNQKFTELNEHDQKFMNNFNTIIDNNYSSSSFDLQKIAALIYMSERQLQRKTKAIFNMTPLDILREYRFQKASELLRKGYQVSIVSDLCGFSSLSYFSQSFKNRYGMTPKQYQKRT